MCVERVDVCGAETNERNNVILFGFFFFFTREQPKESVRCVKGNSTWHFLFLLYSYKSSLFPRVFISFDVACRFWMHSALREKKTHVFCTLSFAVWLLLLGTTGIPEVPRRMRCLQTKSRTDIVSYGYRPMALLFIVRSHHSIIPCDQLCHTYILRSVKSIHHTCFGWHLRCKKFP